MGRASSLLVALACALPACGGDEDDGAGTGGAGGSGGDGGGAGMGPTDVTAPEFGGLTSAQPMGDSRVELSWNAASDDLTPAGRIAYRVYAATAPGQQDFSTPHSTTPAGATGAVVSDLSPNTRHYFVVRAVDAAGNEETNSVEKDAQTTDTAPPRFAGVVAVGAKTSRSLLVEWKPARDRGSAESQMRYRVFVSATQGGQDFANPTVESQPGESSALVTGLEPLTEYFVVVRAVDAAGNADDNRIERSDSTPEGLAPVFTGIVRAEPWASTIKLYWAPAKDNVTEQANIRYNIYEATATNAQNFSSPTYTTEPAAISFVVPAAAPNTRYYYVVRALDAFGNEDANTIQDSARTSGGADTVAPNFPGVESVTASSPTTLLVTWPAAHNDTTEPLVYYDLYVADSSGAQNFGVPSVTAGPNVTSVTLASLAPGATRFVVVRARDAAGNVVANTVERSGSTPLNPNGDLTAPVWGGGPSVSQGASVDTLRVTWAAATDAYPAADIRYHVCVEPQEADCLGSAFLRNIRATSDWGATSLTITGVLPRTRYFVYVRAEDRSGNTETGNHSGVIVSRTGWSANVQPLLLDRCNACHNFLAPTLLNDVPSSYVDPNLPIRYVVIDGVQVPVGMPLVWPGRPEASYLYRKVNPLGLQAPPFSAAIPNNYSGLREPRDGSNLTYTPLSQQEDAILHDWISEGALGD